MRELEIAKKAVQMYAEQHPRPSQVSQKQAGEMLNLSQPTILKMIKAGVLKLNASRMIPIGMIDEALLSRADDKEEGCE